MTFAKQQRNRHWKISAVGLLGLAWLGCSSGVAAEDFPPTDEPGRSLYQLAHPLLETPAPVVSGENGWLFLASEIRHLATGSFWGERAAAVSRATQKDWADPLPAILDFHAQLKKMDIELLFVPVPAKAAIYPEALPKSVVSKEHQTTLGAADRAFAKLLEERGVPVLDLDTALRSARASETRPLYCQQDSHWSGAGAELAARIIAERIREREWFAEIPKQEFQSEQRSLAISGDLWKMREDVDLPQEQLELRFVGKKTESSPEPIAPATDSPILLLGDSHNLVFHAGEELHARGAGLPDQLALELGFPVDLIAVRGSGATPSRTSLLRRKDALVGKKLVIWCLSVREFTESAQGWRSLPISR